MTDLMLALYEFAVSRRMGYLMEDPEYDDFSRCAKLQEQKAPIWILPANKIWTICWKNCALHTARSKKLSFRLPSPCPGS